MGCDIRKKKYFERFFRGNVMQKAKKQTKQQNFGKHCDTQTSLLSPSSMKIMVL